MRQRKEIGDLLSGKKNELLNTHSMIPRYIGEKKSVMEGIHQDVNCSKSPGGEIKIVLRFLSLPRAHTHTYNF